ncbi:hypothetical protein ACEZCY_30790 [Streptacidiphilus sp. N1-12]|uniref:Uncharacterized protein n=2 Tax=Streptacidiphilus alkalitolerans TaxID=3342712 RepID=A0ABV6VI12_9ACTN
MRRGLIRAGAWAGATAAAVSVSWFGVHSVLADSSAVQPRPLVVALNAPVASPVPPPPPAAIGTPAQTPSATPSPSTSTGAGAAGTAGTAPAHRPSSAPPSPTASPTEQVVSYTRPGGIIVVAVGPSSAKLITATPNPGWSVQTWTSAPDWFRVDFVRGGTDTVFYMTWNGHPPMVQD